MGPIVAVAGQRPLDRAASALVTLVVLLSAGTFALLLWLRRALHQLAAAEKLLAPARRGDNGAPESGRRAAKAVQQLNAILRLLSASLWDFVLPEGLVVNSYVADENYLWWEGQSPTPLSRLDFGTILERVGVYAEDRDRLQSAIQECVDKKTPEFRVEVRCRAADGTTRWRLALGTVSRDVNGRPTGFIGTSIDVTELKRAEEETRKIKERLELALRGSQVSVWDLDMRGIAVGDTGLERYNAWESRGPDGRISSTDYRSIIELTVAPEDCARAIAAVEACMRGETPDIQLEFRALGYDDDRLHWRLARGTVLSDADGKPSRLVGTSLDITSLKLVEEERRRAMEAAESANRAKDEFLANVSHEIRTPMNAILGMTGLALDSVLTDHQRQLLLTVKSAARNLLGIINDLLDFSKIAAGKLALDRADFSLRAEIGDTLRALAPRAHRKGLELICHVRSDVPDALFGDAGRLRQVLINLVGNAIKFTAQGEVVVEVTVHSALPHADDTVSSVIRIIDTGIGIALDKQAAIFRAFEQEDASTTRRYGGTGLGLTISAQIAALMDGAITVTSEPGRGSTFEFTARFARSSRPELSLKSSPELLDGLRVLVVDDNHTNRRILAEWLTNWRMTPVAVGDAKSALDELARAEEAEAPYSLVLLDARMPDLDGLTLAGRIFERYGTASKQLILLSSDDNPVLATRSRDAGIRAFLLKPLQQSELLETISLVMNAASQIDEEPIAGTIARHDAKPGASRASLRVLVAEDNELNVALLQELLSERGHRAQFVGDGRTALARATEGTFDLLLLDLHMPEMDGVAVVEAIRARERTVSGHLPIIALTARSSSGDRERCLAAGVDDFLSKPIEAAALWAAVDRFAASSQPAKPRESWLLDSRAIRRACGGQAAVFESLREVFRKSLRDHLMQVQSFLRERDLPRLRDAARRLHGTLGSFSSVAGAVAASLEDAALREDVMSCEELVGQLEPMCAELLEETRSVTLDDLGL